MVTLKRPSEPRLPLPADIETASPVPLSRVGLFEYAKVFLMDSFDDFGFFRLKLRTCAELAPVLLESGEPQWLVSGGEDTDEIPKDGRPKVAIRGLGVGGCGNDGMLTDRRTTSSAVHVFPELAALDIVLKVGTKGVELAYNGFGPVPDITVLDIDGARKPCFTRPAGAVVPTFEGVLIPDLKAGVMVALLDDIVFPGGDRIGIFGTPFGLTGLDVARYDILEGV